MSVMRLLIRRDGDEWREATVVGSQVELQVGRGGQSVTWHRVSFEDGVKRWVNLSSIEHVDLASQRSDTLACGRVVAPAASAPRERLVLQCALSHRRLTDPAKGASCHHLSRFNYDDLLDHVLAKKRCAADGTSRARWPTEPIVHPVYPAHPARLPHPAPAHHE